MQREKFESDVVHDAQRRFEANGGPPLYVSVTWYGHRVTDARESVVSAIADVVAARFPTVPATERYVRLRIDNYDLPESLQQWVAAIGILNAARGTAHFWTVAQAGYTDADPAVIRERIAAKEKKLLSYRPCNETWLLIHAGGASMASTMTLSELAAGQTYPTAFDRVYVLEFNGNLHRLQT